jgi:hypothetical protein
MSEANHRMLKRFLLAALLATGALLAACLPADRLNVDCRWIGDSGMIGNRSIDDARRSHLAQDVAIAQELSIRFADSVGGRNLDTPARQRLQDDCFDRSLTAIGQQHGTPPAELRTLIGTRQLWIDFLLVFLPTAIAFGFASHVIVKRLTAQYDGEDWHFVVVVLLVLTPVVAALGLAATQWWGWFVEGYRVRNGHISSRASALPGNRYGWTMWYVGVSIFAAVSWLRVRRLTRSAPRPDSTAIAQT